MSLSKNQRKQIKKLALNNSLEVTARTTGLKKVEVENFLRGQWGDEKFGKRFLGGKGGDNLRDIADKIRRFGFVGFIKGNWVTLVALALTVIAVYANSLNSPFLSDDKAAILNNPDIANFSKVFVEPLLFVRRLLYYLVFHIGGLSPIYFRLIDVVAHIGTVWLIFLIVGLLINRRVSIVAALLFAVHPLAVESVTWISGGIHSQYTFFCLLSFMFFLFALYGRNPKQNMVISSIIFTFALMSSEKSLVLPIIEAFFLLSFNKLSEWKKLVPSLTLNIIFGVNFARGIFQRSADFQQKFTYQAPTLNNPFIQIPTAISEYIRLFLFPIDLTLYHSELHLSPLLFLLRVALTVAFFGLIICLLGKKVSSSFWLGMMVISLLPTFLPFGLSWVVAERYFYMGMIGFCVFSAILFEKMFKSRRYKVFGYFILGCVVLAFSVRTIARNVDWQTEDNLWIATAALSPSNPTTHNNMGDVYSRDGDFEKAVYEFTLATKMNPRYADAYHNLANTYFQMGKLDLAIDNYLLAINFNPMLWQSYQNLGLIYYQQGKIDLAIENINKALKINPQDTKMESFLREITKLSN